jgi:hypothetical protein
MPSSSGYAVALATAREQGRVKGRAEGARQMRERALTALPEN